MSAWKRRDSGEEKRHSGCVGVGVGGWVLGDVCVDGSSITTGFGGRVRGACQRCVSEVRVRGALDE